LSKSSQTGAIFRSFSSSFSAIFGHFRPDFNIHDHVRVECRCCQRGTPPRRDADCGSQWHPRLRACAPPGISQWVGIWRIDGLLAQKLSERGVLCGILLVSPLSLIVRKAVAAGVENFRSKAVRRPVNEVSYGDCVVRNLKG
jgi:hypothetical protein